MNFTAPKLWRFEHGVQQPKADELEAIARALGVEMQMFYGNLVEAKA